MIQDVNEVGEKPIEVAVPITSQPAPKSIDEPAAPHDCSAGDKKCPTGGERRLKHRGMFKTEDLA